MYLLDSARSLLVLEPKRIRHLAAKRRQKALQSPGAPGRKKRSHEAKRIKHEAKITSKWPPSSPAQAKTRHWEAKTTSS